MTRSNAREIAVHLVYGLHYTDETAQQLMDVRMDADYYEELKSVDEIYAERPNRKQMEYIRTLVSGIQEKRSELDEHIERLANNWKLSRISRISRAIMEVAMYEILYVEDVPAGVAINEAVELCKRYEESETVAFVNGILGRFEKEVAGNVSGN